MNLTVTNTELEQLSHFIEKNMALHFPKTKWGEFERNIISTAKQLGYEDISTFIEHIISSPISQKTIDILASKLTINETYFWREHQTFEALEQKILNDIKERKKDSYKSLKIWSAGCSGGEEPYSIAIALKHFLPDISDWNIKIIATDISPVMLKKAEKGIYGSWSFRSTPEWIRELYFTQIETGKFQIKQEIKDMVSFSYLNLADDNYPSIVNDTNALDIIYCRNVLMYFTSQRFKEVGKRFYNSLVDGGYLVVSSSELSSMSFPDFEIINVPDFVLYRKTIDYNYNHHNHNNYDHNNFYPYTNNSDYDEYVVDEVLDEAVDVVLDEVVDEVMDDIPVPEIILSEKTNYLLDESDKKVEINDEQIKEEYHRGNYIKVIEQLSEVEISGQKQLILIKSHANLGNIDTALSICEESIKNNKLDSKLYFLYANILLNKDNLDEAINALKKAIFIDSEFALAYYSLANSLIKKGNLVAGLKNYENAITELEKLNSEELIPEAEGITAGRLKEIINSTMQKHTSI